MATSSGSSSSPHAVTEDFRRTEAAAARADRDKEERGFFFLPRLDYDTEAGIVPLMSRRQFDVQYHWFHKDAVQRLNRHTIGTELEGHNLDVVIRKTAFDASRAVVHGAASEHFNYCFWYKSLRPWGTPVPPRLREQLQLQYGRNGTLDALEEVKRLMTVTALSQQQQCGWVYLVWTGKVFDVVDFPHGSCPIGSDLIPLLGLNIHTSAMYFDYDYKTMEGVERYVRNYFKTCNWPLAEHYYLQAVQNRE